jgi:voltage-dependent anion channel protein 2
VFKGPTTAVDAAIGADGFVAGAEVAYNVQDGKISKYAAALGYSNSDYSVALHALNNFSTFSASYFHRVSADLEAGAKAVWDKKSVASNVALEVGGKYVLDKDAFAKAKVNNAGILGLGFTQTVRPGVKVSLGGSFDTARFNENVHKLGLSLVLEA